jgi:hypothetical protein
LSRGPRFHFATTLFGAQYLEQFLLGGLPSQLSANNLPSLAHGPRPRYHLFTTPAEVAVLRHASQLSRLADLADIRFHDISELVSRCRNRACSAYSIMNLDHRQVLQEALEDGGAVVALCPDILYSDGTIRRLRDLADQGIRGVAATGNQASPALLEAARAAYLDAGGEVLTLPPRELVSLALAHLTPYWNQFFADHPCFPSEDATHIQWRVGNEGILTHTSFLHPILAVPTAAACRFSQPGLWNGLDTTSFLATLTDDPDRDLYFVTDSDDFCFVGLDSRAVSFRDRPRPLNRVEMALAIARTAHSMTAEFFRKPIRFRSTSPSAAWDRAEQEARTLVEGVLGVLELVQVRPEVRADLLSLQARGEFTPANEFLFDRVKARINALAALWQAGGRRVAVHGASAWARRLLGETALGQCDVVAVVDSNPALHGKPMLDWTVGAPDQLPSLAPDAVLVASFRAWPDISRQLRDLPGFTAELHPLLPSPEVVP